MVDYGVLRTRPRMSDRGEVQGEPARIILRRIITTRIAPRCKTHPSLPAGLDDAPARGSWAGTWATWAARSLGPLASDGTKTVSCLQPDIVKWAPRREKKGTALPRPPLIVASQQVWNLIGSEWDKPSESVDPQLDGDGLHSTKHSSSSPRQRERARSRERCSLACAQAVRIRISFNGGVNNDNVAGALHGRCAGEFR